jgi:hypothetical protein
MRLQGLLDSIRCEQDVYDDRYYAGRQFGIGGVAHQNGTNCRMHQVDNLFVADSSSLVSSSAVNPTFTIVAKAPRVTDGIADRLGVRTGADGLQ